MKNNNANKVMEEQPSIVIRQRKRADGTASLYMDIHYKGKRYREQMNLVLLVEDSKDSIRKNENTMLSASKLVEDKKKELIANDSCPGLRLGLFEYYNRYYAELFNTGDQSKWGDACSSLRLLEKYADAKTMLTDVDRKFLNGFKNFLDSQARFSRYSIVDKVRYESDKLSRSTKHSYFVRLKNCIVKAYEDGLIKDNPFMGKNGVKGYTCNNHDREILYLDWEDIEKLYQAECRTEVVKRAFLFSCYTGLIYNQIQSLKWDDIKNDNDSFYISLLTPKNEIHKVVIPKPAMEFVGVLRKGQEKVFEGLKYSSKLPADLRYWGLDAGVVKNFTFYSAKHSYIMFLLNNGIEEDVVASMLGHNDANRLECYRKYVRTK